MSTPEARAGTWPVRGVRVEGDSVIVTAKGGDDAARWLCGAILAMKEAAPAPVAPTWQYDAKEGRCVKRPSAPSPVAPESFDAWWDDPTPDGPRPDGPVSRATAQWIWDAAIRAAPAPVAPTRPAVSQQRIREVFQMYGTGRLDGFTAAVRAIEATSQEGGAA